MAFDREKHWIAAAGLDQAAAYGAARATSAIAPATEVLRRARETGKGARNALWASRAMKDRRELGAVGTEWFHTMSDRKRAIEEIGAGFRDLAADLTTWNAEPSDKTAATAQWVKIDVIPALLDWNTWSKGEIESWFVRTFTSWDTFEKWHARLMRLRELARAHGIVLCSPEPLPLQKTIWDAGAAGNGGKLGAALGAGKIVFAAAVGIAGFITVVAAVNSFRTYLNREPGEDK